MPLCKEPKHYTTIARILELTACHLSGIKILSIHLKKVVELLALYMNPNNDMSDVKYPAATVLLDLTANEECIESVAKLIVKHDILSIVL